MKNIRSGVAAAIVFSALASSAPAFALSNTVSVTVGPAPLPNVPVSVCLNATCVTPPSYSVGLLSVTATADLAIGALPTITPGICPAGQGGVVLVVTTGTSTTIVSATVSGTGLDGSPFSLPLGPVTVSPSSKTVTVSACST